MELHGREGSIQVREPYWIIPASEACYCVLLIHKSREQLWFTDSPPQREEALETLLTMCPSSSFSLSLSLISLLVCVLSAYTHTHTTDWQCLWSGWGNTSKRVILSDVQPCVSFFIQLLFVSVSTPFFVLPPLSHCLALPPSVLLFRPSLNVSPTCVTFLLSQRSVCYSTSSGIMLLPLLVSASSSSSSSVYLPPAFFSVSLLHLPHPPVITADLHVCKCHILKVLQIDISIFSSRDALLSCGSLLDLGWLFTVMVVSSTVWKTRGCERRGLRTLN